jgi:putative PIN family toxin of toxin-antitoxin system
MTAPEPPRAVFDCMTFLQATARPTGPAAACLRLLEAGAVGLFVSDDVLREVEDVLSRPNLRRKNPLLTDQAVRLLLDRLAQLATRLDPVPFQFPYPRDPKDEPYLNLAIAAGASYLVTWDKDLLDLMADNPDGTAFRSRFSGLLILTPVAFLRELGQLSGPPPAAPGSVQESKD